MSYFDVPIQHALEQEDQRTMRTLVCKDAHYSYVDLGTKLGGALDSARKIGKAIGMGAVDPSRCLGVDRNDDFRKQVTDKGYNFYSTKLPDPGWELPTSDCYLAWDFLEHLDDIETAQEVLRQMIQRSTKLVWLVMPNFEPCDLARTLSYGYDLRWYMTPWHKAYVTKSHVNQVASELDSRVARVEWRPRKHVKKFGTRDLQLQPGATPRSGLIKPSLVGAWEARLWLR